MSVGHRQRRGHRDQHVDDAGHDHAADEGARERLVRVDGLLGDVGGVLEAGHREEGERDAGEHRQRRVARDADVDRGSPKSALPSATYQMPMTITMIRPLSSTKVISMLITTDSVMPMKLTTHQGGDEHQRDQQRRRTAAHSSAKYDAKPVASEPGGGEARGQEGDGDQEGQRLVAERLVDVERGAGGLGVLGDQLGVRRPGDGGDGDADREGDPERAADRRGDQADQDVDARARGRRPSV